MKKSLLLASLCISSVATATGQETRSAEPSESVTLETVTVYGRAIELIGEAGAASEGVVGAASGATLARVAMAQAAAKASGEPVVGDDGSGD